MDGHVPNDGRTDGCWCEKMFYWPGGWPWWWKFPWVYWGPFMPAELPPKELPPKELPPKDLLPEEPLPEEPLPKEPTPPSLSSARSCMSEVQSVRLSRSSCMINVLSLYESSPRVSSSAMESSKACLARWQARSGELRIS